MLPVEKRTGGIEGFKGTYYDIGEDRWLEGVGSTYEPWLSLHWNGSGNNEGSVRELMDIRQSRMTIEHFEQLTATTGLCIVRRTLWLVNPHYQQKFGLRPRVLWSWAAALPLVRNFYTTSAFYLLSKRL